MSFHGKEKINISNKKRNFKKQFLLATATGFLFSLSSLSLSASAGVINQDNIVTKELLSPTLGNYGLDLTSMDKKVDPGEDFFLYVNGKWVDEFEIPSDKSGYGSFYVLHDKAEEDIKKIINDLAKSNPSLKSEEGKIGALYTAYIDTDTIYKRGIGHLNKYIKKIDKLKNHDQISEFMGQYKINSSSFVGGYVYNDFKNPDIYTLYLTQSGLGLPNRNYYLDERFEEVREKYKGYIEKMLTLANLVDSDDMASAVLKIYSIEEKIAKAHWSPEARRDREKTYNPISVKELATYAPGFDWEGYLKAGGIKNIEEIVIMENTALQELAKIFEKTNIDDLKLYLKFHLFDEYAHVLPKEFDDAKFDMFGKTLSGVPEQRARWKRAITQIDQALGEAVGKVYVERHFPESSKEKMEKLVDNLILAYEESIKSLDWMSDETKEEALKKLSAFNAKIGYPNKWRDYSKLKIRKGKAFENDLAISKFENEYWVNKIGKKVDKEEWGITPQTINAYYSPGKNEIVFPAAILQAPFFDPEADDAVNYGGIGAVIGHEIGHGFDDQGRKTDGTGELRDWWTEEDAKRFNKKAEMLGSQYAKYEPIKGHFVNPKLTMGENIGDLGGVDIALKAYKMSLNGNEAPVIDGLTGTQRLFLSWAQVWRSKFRDESMIRRVTTDSHSPPQYRVNGVVRNIDDWYDSFDIDKDDPLYLPEDKRVTIW